MAPSSAIGPRRRQTRPCRERPRYQSSVGPGVRSLIQEHTSQRCSRLGLARSRTGLATRPDPIIAAAVDARYQALARHLLDAGANSHQAIGLLKEDGSRAGEVTAHQDLAGVQPSQQSRKRSLTEISRLSKTTSPARIRPSASLASLSKLLTTCSPVLAFFTTLCFQHLTLITTRINHLLSDSLSQTTSFTLQNLTPRSTNHQNALLRLLRRRRQLVGLCRL